jgi:hypothetical protein
MFLAYFLPTITVLQDKLVAKRFSVTVCKPLISDLINGLNNQFAEACADAEMAAAAVLHAKLKNSWTNNPVVIQKALEHIQNLLDSSYFEPKPSYGSSADGE